MIKYTILYKNGKTWNGRANSILQIKPIDCVLMAAHKPSGYTYLYHASVGGWVFFEELLTDAYNGPSERTPNPKSKTKKQKAFDEAYRKWWSSKGFKLDMSIKAYKKWLYEQRKTNPIKCFPSFSVGDKIGYCPQGSDELTWCTITEAGYTSPYTIKVTATMPSEIDKAITQIHLSYEEPNDGWITWNGGEMPVPKGTMVHVKYRDGVETICSAGIMGWEEGFEGNVDGRSAVNWKHPHNSIWDIVAYKLYEDPKKVTFIKPIKTPYTFWLGAFGEIND